MAARDWIEALRRSHDDVQTIVAPLTAKQIRSSSACSEWSIAQVCSHLGSGAEISRLWLETAIAASPLPGREVMQPIWDVWNARSAEEQVARSLIVNEEYVSRFEGLSDAVLDRLRLELFGMELDASGVARFRLGEHALHRWDIAVALDPGARLLPSAVHLLVDELAFMVARRGQPTERGFRLRVETADPTRVMTLESAERVTLASGAIDVPVDGVLRMPAEELVRMVYGRLHHADVCDARLDSDWLSLDEVAGLFPPF